VALVPKPDDTTRDLEPDGATLNPTTSTSVTTMMRRRRSFSSPTSVTSTTTVSSTKQVAALDLGSRPRPLIQARQPEIWFVIFFFESIFHVGSLK
jgi:hypothetical protein